MGLFDGFKRRKTSTLPGQDEESRELQKKTRAHNYKLKELDRQIEQTQLEYELTLKQAQLEDLKQELLGDEGEDEMLSQLGLGGSEMQLINVLTGGKFLQGLGALTPQPTTTDTTTTATPPVSTEDNHARINAMIEKAPRHLLKQAKKMKPEDLFATLKTYFPQETDEDLFYAAEKIKSFK